MARRIWTVVLVALVAATAIGVSIGQDSSTSTEVRINARQLEDGRVEFGLQQREGGDWGERILPQVRMMPADAPAGEWLSTSSIMLQSEPSSPDRILASTDGWTTAREEGGLSYRVEAVVDDAGSVYLQSELAIQIGDQAFIHGVDNPYPAIWLVISCVDGVRSIEIQFVRSEPATSSRFSYQFFLADYVIHETEAAAFGLSSEGSRSVSGLVWRAWDDYVGYGTTTVNVRRDNDLYFGIRDAYALYIELIGSGSRDTFIAELDGVWDTPVQPNLDRCGSYSWRSLPTLNVESTT